MANKWLGDPIILGLGVFLAAAWFLLGGPIFCMSNHGYSCQGLCRLTAPCFFGVTK